MSDEQYEQVFNEGVDAAYASMGRDQLYFSWVHFVCGILIGMAAMSVAFVRW